MSYHFARDLRVARRKASLTQTDLAHLLDVDYTRVSRLESGKTPPTAVELSILCLVFDGDIERLHEKIIEAEATTLGQRLGSMPDCPKSWPNWRNRVETLKGVAARLASRRYHD